MLKNIRNIESNQIHSLPRGTNESLTTYINSIISAFVKNRYLPENGTTIELANEVIGLYLYNKNRLGHLGAREFVRNNFAVVE
jgi:hypothetical protein